MNPSGLQSSNKQGSADGHHGIHLSKKISGNKHKRSGRDKSYDLYSQKL